MVVLVVVEVVAVVVAAFVLVVVLLPLEDVGGVVFLAEERKKGCLVEMEHILFYFIGAVTINSTGRAKSQQPPVVKRLTIRKLKTFSPQANVGTHFCLTAATFEKLSSGGKVGEVGRGF